MDKFKKAIKKMILDKNVEYIPFEEITTLIEETK